MFSTKTVFVVGAGASREAGLPTGDELRPIIADKLNLKYDWTSDPLSPKSGDRAIAGALFQYSRQTQQDMNTFLPEAWKISEAMPQAISIDNFMDAHSDNFGIQLCGKLSIVQAILEAETNSKLMIDERKQKPFDPNRLSGTWYEAFFKMLTENVRLKDIDDIFKNVSFTVFNYDRCIEQFLFKSLQNYYRIDSNDAFTLLERLNINHPYGSVGQLLTRGPGGAVSFGGQNRGINLIDIASQIKTFTEQVEDEAARDALRAQVQQADTLVFLGFAFHQLNMELITPETKSECQRTFGTAFGISEADIDVIQFDIHKMLNRQWGSGLQIHLNNKLTCAELFPNYWRSLSQR